MIFDRGIIVQPNSILPSGCVSMSKRGTLSLIMVHLFHFEPFEIERGGIFEKT